LRNKARPERSGSGLSYAALAAQRRYLAEPERLSIAVTTKLKLDIFFTFVFIMRQNITFCDICAQKNTV
jgi:hypothetical protein